MSFSYQQYVDYSNPTTPRVYAWEVASATSEQDPTLQSQDVQDPPASIQQPQQISPSQLQLHQLPILQGQPSTPQEQHPVQQPQPQQQQRQQYPTHQSIIVQPPPPPTVHRYRFETVTEQDFIQAAATERSGASRSTRRAASKPPLHVETERRASSSSSAAVSPGALPASGMGRVPHTRAHVQSAHPYRRPQSRAGAGAGASAASASGSSVQQHAAVRSRRISELQSAQTSVGGVSTSHTGGALPTVGTQLGVSCPAAGSWREGLKGSVLSLSLSSSGQGHGATGTSFDMEAGSAGSASATPLPVSHEPLPTGLVIPFPSEPVRRYSIRTDIHFSIEDNMITAMFELPGVKRDDLRITMSVCPFTRVRQVSVAGISRGVLPLQGHQVRERKFGEFIRTLTVPPETKPEDIAVNLEDGILTLKIPGGTPAETEEHQSIPIPMTQ